jgi:hypothetical protein
MVISVDIDALTGYDALSSRVWQLVPLLANCLTSCEVPKELLLLTAEIHIHDSDECRVVLAASDLPRIAGRAERYSNCLFSGYEDRSGEIVSVDNVKDDPSYLELDPRVLSEVFWEKRIAEHLGLILNAELSSMFVPAGAINWFRRVVELVEGGLRAP